MLGFTVIAAVVAPVDHAYVVPPLAVNVALAPLQIVDEFTLTVGIAFTVTVEVLAAEQPFVVPVTV